MKEEESRVEERRGDEESRGYERKEERGGEETNREGRGEMQG